MSKAEADKIRRVFEEFSEELNRPDPRPKDLGEVCRIMRKIDPRSLSGSQDDPNGGDLRSHLAHIDFFKKWNKKQRTHGSAE